MPRNTSRRHQSGSRNRDSSGSRDRRVRSRNRNKSRSYSIESSDSSSSYRNKGRRSRNIKGGYRSHRKSRRSYRSHSASKSRDRSYTPPRRRVQENSNPPRLGDSTDTMQKSALIHDGRNTDSLLCGSEASSLTQAIVDAVRAMQPTHSLSYFVSSFDPSINNFEIWCNEVDHARELNRWSDHECLSRVANCLKGDAKVWLGEWVTADRTWSNFKSEFISLCPAKLDYANILYDAMSNSSDKYDTYAEYARRTLLRLRIVQGLSDELRILIIIRGIVSPQVRAAAANADLNPTNIVSFLSIYAKPNFCNTRESRSTTAKFPSRPPKPGNHNGDIKCFICNKRGHVRVG